MNNKTTSTKPVERASQLVMCMEYRSDFVFSTWKSILITWQSKGTSEAAALLFYHNSFLHSVVLIKTTLELKKFI